MREKNNYMIYFILLLSFSYGLNNKPLIGVLTVPSELDDYDDAKYSTLDASYVKYVESGGAIVIPI